MTKRPYPMNNFSSQTKNKKKTEKLLICQQASVKKNSVIKRGLCKLSKIQYFSMAQAVSERDNYLFHHNMCATEPKQQERIEKNSPILRRKITNIWSCRVKSVSNTKNSGRRVADTRRIPKTFSSRCDIPRFFDGLNISLKILSECYLMRSSVVRNHLTSCVHRWA